MRNSVVALASGQQFAVKIVKERISGFSFGYLTFPYARRSKSKKEQVAQLSQRDRDAGWLVMAKSGRLKLGDNILRTL